MVKELVRSQDWVIKVDLKDTYFLVPIHPGHHKYLQFQWEGHSVACHLACHVLQEFSQS